MTNQRSLLSKAAEVAFYSGRRAAPRRLHSVAYLGSGAAETPGENKWISCLL